MNIPIKPPKKKLAHTFLFQLLLVLNLSQIAFAQTPSEILERKIKKVIMILNILSREYALAVDQGQIINSVEYKESQVFLDQAKQVISIFVESSKHSSSVRSLVKSFDEIANQIRNKSDPKEIKIATNSLQTQILTTFGIEFKPIPTRSISLNNGRQIYRANCKICHGPEGQGDGLLAQQFEPKPAVLSDPKITGDGQTAASENFEVINVGIANTAMVGWADTFAEEDIWDVTYYIRTFSNASAKLPVIAALSSTGNTKDLDKMFAEIKDLLKRSLSAFHSNQMVESEELAFEAYLAYEKVESALVAKDKLLGTRLESSFTNLRGEIKRKAPAKHIETLVSELQQDLDQGLPVLKEEIGSIGFFIQSFSIIVREGFEAILILAAIIAFLIKSRNRDQVKIIYIGASIGILASLITAYIFNEVIKINTANQEVMEGVVMLVAVALLFYISYWLISKIGAQKFQQYVNVKLRQAISTASIFTLGMLAFLSVYREGFETVLFYQALYAYAGSNTTGIIPGFSTGCACLALVFYLINRLGIRIPVRWFFAVTGVFLYYMAFTFMGRGLHALQVGGSLSITLIDFIPKITWMGVYPTWETFIGQAILVVAYVFALFYTFGIKSGLGPRN